jgi:hypothetical protein
VLGSFSPTGYINNFGPIGPAGSVAETSSNIVTVATSTATSTTTGALQVAGGAGIAGNLYTGGNLVVGANLTVLGNLIVQGEVTTLNTTILAIEDLNITVAKDAVSSAAADGAGITVGGAGATFNYVASTDAWTSNKNIYASAYYTGGDIKWSGNSAVYRSGINYTPSATAPINSNYGDQWYDTTTDILYEWQTADGVNGFWIDIGSLAIVANANLSATTFASITAGNISAGNINVSTAIANSRINSRTTTTASTPTLTPNISMFDQYNLTAQAEALSIAAPTGTPVDGNKLMFRLLDNGTARALTWNATYTVIGVTLPTTTVINKTTYVGCIYNDNNTRWDVIAVATQA